MREASSQALLATPPLACSARGSAASCRHMAAHDTDSVAGICARTAWMSNDKIQTGRALYLHSLPCAPFDCSPHESVAR